MSRKTTAALIAALGITCLLTGCKSPRTGGQARAALHAESNDPSGFTERFTVPLVGTRINFDMVRVPGDAAVDVEAFYISTHEVIWRDFYDWMYITDIDDPAERDRLIREGLRPSPLYELQKGFQVDDRDNPAMGMTRWTAEVYCVWLSEQTGREYRLPTLAEWRHAAEVGGGLPEDLDAAAWHAGNAPVNETWQVPKSAPAGSKRPNALGIYDLFGNVAEWVIHPEGVPIIVGGSINNPPAEIGTHWQAEENTEVWSETYPQRPFSRYWYMDYYFTGIRLVCEPASVAANPPQQAE